jgi:hypothetical protein
MDQQEVDDLELQLMYAKIEEDDLIPQDETEVGDADHEVLKKCLLSSGGRCPDQGSLN